MRTKVLIALSFLAALGRCLPQGFGNPIRTTITIGGFTFTETINLPTDTPTRVTSIDPGNGRTTVIGGTSTRKDTSTSSISSKSSSTVLPPPSSSTSSKTVITTASPLSTTTTSSIIKTLPPTTLTTSPTQTTTSFSSTTTTSSIIKTLPPTTVPTKTATPTNPWSSNCPVPSNFIVNNFISISGEGGGVSLTLTYGNGTFTCPNTPTSQVTYNGVYDMLCSDDGISRVITDGFSWIWVQEWYWCLAVPQPKDSFSTLQTLSNYTSLASALNCNTDDAGVQTCFQEPPNLTIPVQSYGTGGIIGFAPMDVNGNPLPQCTSLFMTNPIITNTATCTASSAASVTTATTTVTATGKETITIATTHTATVTVT